MSSELVLILDRTQWQNTNILMISLAWKKRAIPLYWKILTVKELSLPLFWFPLVKKIIENLFSISSELVLILDRTQWQNTNILMINLALKKREYDYIGKF